MLDLSWVNFRSRSEIILATGRVAIWDLTGHGSRPASVEVGALVAQLFPSSTSSSTSGPMPGKVVDLREVKDVAEDVEPPEEDFLAAELDGGAHAGQGAGSQRCSRRCGTS